MSRRAWVLIAAAVVIATWSLVLPLGAAAVHTNADCASCHGADSLVSNALFDVGAVNKATACRKCHLDSLVGTHPRHYGGGNCAAMCHRAWGTSLPSNTPTVLEAEGAFASPDSPDAPAYVLHAIHTNPRWMVGISTTDSKCGSCHAVASCTACHNGVPAPDATHAEHGSGIPTTSPIVPWVGDVSIGVVASQDEDTRLEDYPVLCGASGCHDASGIALSSPQFMDVYAVTNAELGFITPAIGSTGTWRDLVATGCSLQREKYSNTSGSEYALTFTGERVAIYGTKDQYRGIAEVRIDGSVVATFSAFNGTTLRQRPLWTSADLGPGAHTVSVRVTGTKEPLARGVFVSVDHIAIYGTANDSISPNCGSCHPTEEDETHGGEHPVALTFSHDVTQTVNAANTWDTGYGTYACNQCHQSQLRLEHRRATTAGYATYPDSCSVCHASSNPVTEAQLALRRTPTGSTWTGVYDVATGCSDPDFDTVCHSATSFPSSRQRHETVVAQHAANTSGESPACAGCHGSDLRNAHSNPIPGNGKVEANSCLVCHGPTRLETNRTCSQGAAPCHSGGYGAVSSHAIKDSGSHLASDTGKPFTRAYQASAGTDDGGVECAMCHSSQLIPAHSDSPAVGCATGGAGGKGCHLDTAYDSIAVAASGWASRRCADCHDYATQQSHDSTTAPHAVANNGCAGTGASCHDSNDLWELHIKSQNGTPRPDKGCNVIGCHTALDDRPVLVSSADSCGSTSPTGCHSSYTASHVSNFSHTFSAVSYYNGASETGCTNQTGCHNVGANSTADFGDDHHPVSGPSCFASACHTSASKAAFTGILPTDCQECHGGAFVGAPARNTLTAAPGSGGHYSETTHTAVGMAAAINAGGSASATCNSCHSPAVGGSSNGLMNQHSSITIAGSPYGAALTCGECHGDTRAFGNSQVVANWSTDTCTDCHTAGSSPLDHAASVPTVAESGSSCGATGVGCHNTTDLHALHKDAAGCNLTGCHIYTQQSQRPTAKGCGGATSCHTGYTNTSHGTITGNEATHTAGGMTGVLDATYNSGGANTCATCHSAGLEAAHGTSVTGDLASPAWTSPMCEECHGGDTSPVTGSVNVIKTTKWPAKSCDECHGGSNGPAKHSEYVTGHVGVESGCAWSAACHGDTRDLRELHNNSVTSNASTAGCDTVGCHDAQNKQMQTAAKTCGTTGTCHTDKNESNHGAATAHVYTAASDYAETSDGVGSEAGCSGSGAGCHGAIGTRNGVDEFHAAKSAGCTATDACHGDAVFDQAFRDSGSGTDCVRCHDSTAFAATTDDMPLSGASPAGHYDNALHTAVAGLGTVTSAGTASAACSDCHSLDLKGAHGAARSGFSSTTKGAYVTCQECHQYNAALVAEVKTGNWTLNRCDDCHNATDMGAARAQHGVTAPAVAEVTTTCGSTGINCHNTTDLHGLHKNAAGGCSLSGCHDYAKQAFVPTAKSCGVGGACHTTYTKTTHLHAADAAKHQPTVLTPANDTSYYSTSCGTCHDMRNAQSSLTSEHALATSAKSTVPTDNCANCHNNPAATTAVTNNWSAKDTPGTGATSSCGVCHQSGSLAIHTDASSTAHVATNTGCANTGIGCHNSNDLSSVGATATAANTVLHNNCAHCHDRAGATSWSSAMVGLNGNLKYNPTVDQCGQATGCHTSTFYTTTSHRTTLTNPVTGNEATWHTATGMTSTITSGVASAACSACHSATLLAAHDPAKTTNNLNSGHTAWSSTANTTCQDCHNENRAPTASAATQVKGHWTNNLCTDCHTPSYHNTYSTGHTGTSTQGCGASGVGCHNTYDLAALHGVTRTNGCQLAGCHDAVDKGMTSAAKSCGSGGTCHNTYTASSHGTITGNETTHTAAAMTTILDATYNAGGANVCNTCHSAGLEAAHGISITGNLATPAWAAPMCDECHGGDTSPVTGSVNVIKTTKWPAKSCDECHGSPNGPAKHTEYATGHTGTHTGWTCSSASCHVTSDLRALHNDSVTGNASTAGCDSAGCHDSVNKEMQSAAKSCGQGNTCHTDKTDSNHGADHMANYLGLVNGITYTYDQNYGCFGCHYPDLLDEHGATAGRNWSDSATGDTTQGVGCGVCHTNKGGTVGTNANETAIQTAITNGDKRCIACHNGTETNGTGAYHQGPLGTNSTTEFVNWTNGGGHNAFGSTATYPKTSFANVNGVAVTWPWPAAATFNAPYTTTSMVRCADCHGEYTATGPQGASTPVRIDPNYSQTEWASPTANNFGATGTNRVVCLKCHTNIANYPGGHQNHSGRAVNSGGACIDCHMRMPHAWKRARMLRRTAGGTVAGVAADTTPYVDATAGLTGFRVKANMSTWTGNSDCQTNCGRHVTTNQATTWYWP